MSANVIRLPTAAPSFYTVRRARGAWIVEIVTPSRPQALRTAVASSSDRETAVTYGRKAAEQTGRGFKLNEPGEADQ